MKSASDKLISTVDLAGTFVFAVEGAMAAIQGRLDLFGVLVLAFATASGGGIIRDLLIGDVPPASIRDRRYVLIAFAGGVLAFCFYGLVAEIPTWLMVTLDAAGLGLFAVAGAAKALDRQLDPLLAILMGTITGVGGGTVRDVLLSRIPAILRVDIYAVAALLGATVLVLGLRRGLPRGWVLFAGAAACFLLRLAAVWQHWHLPTVAAS